MTEPQPKRRWLRFSLRTFFVLLTLLCIWLGLQVNAARCQRDAVAAIVKAGGDVRYDYQKVQKYTLQTGWGFNFDASIPPPTPAWLRHLFGDDFFCNAASVMFPRCTIAESDWKQIAQLPKLESLGLNDVSIISKNSIENRRLTDSDLDVLRSLRQLRSIWLSVTYVEGSGFASLQNLKPVAIALKKSPIDDAGLQEIGKFTTLKHFSTDSPFITDVGLQHLKLLVNLEALSLVDTHITNEGLEHLKPLVSLEALSLVDDKHITNAGLQYLKELTKLKWCELSGTKVTDEAAAELRKALRNAKIQ